jgi:CubicO group peptidase (beta-lactamase class C family)
VRFQPGEKWEYSNLGYFILAEVIRKVSGQSWSEFLKQNVFSPVGMHSTRTTTMRDSVPLHARGYSDNDEWRDAADWRAVRPSGAFLSTILDLAKWDAALYTNEVLNEASRRQMWTPVTLNDGRSHPYGFGWHVASLAGRKAVYHGGGLPGFASHYARFVDDGLTIIVLTNIDDVDLVSIVGRIATFYLPARTN